MSQVRGDYIKIKDLTQEEKSRLSSCLIDIDNLENCYIIPGFTDVHTHLREPGFLYKETIYSGTMAAAAGGFCNVFAMPNLRPAPDCKETLDVELRAIKRDAQVNVYPYGTLTKEQKGKELSRMDEISEYVCAFTDDGFGVNDENVMKEALKKASSLGKIVVSHCEDLNFRKEQNENEWMQLKRDIELLRKYPCAYHVCHVSTKESIKLIRDAKNEGLDITCETAPHYLLLSTDDIKDEGRFKMNPPIKSYEDKCALIEALKDGTIDMIATDHAPHSKEEKDKGFSESLFGIVGLECAFSVLFSYLVKKDVISLERLIELMSKNPMERFGLKYKSLREELLSDEPTFCVWDLDDKTTINANNFLSKGKSTPFDAWSVDCSLKLNVVNGKKVWEGKNE